MKLAIAGIVCALAGSPAWSADRWEYRGDDGPSTSNQLQPGIVQEGHDLEPKQNGPDADWYQVVTHRERSYEVRVFGGGVAWKFANCQACATLDVMARDGSVATPGDNDQTYGPGGQSVRWIGGPGVVPLRVTPGTEGANSPLEKYDILLLDTTLFLPRFNNIGSQRTVLIVQNLRERAVSGQIFFRQNDGLAAPAYPFTIAPQASLVLDTGKLPQVGQSSGSASIAHTGGWGALAGKTVVLEPSTGFTFDTMLTTAPR